MRLAWFLTISLNLKTLRHVSIVDQALDDYAVCQLTDKIISFMPITLPILVLCGNSGMTDTSAHHLARVLDRVEALHLRDNPHIGNRGALYLAQGLEVNRTTHTLTLERCGMGDAGAKALFESISNYNDYLRVLSVDSNEPLTPMAQWPDFQLNLL